MGGGAILPYLSAYQMWEIARSLPCPSPTFQGLDSLVATEPKTQRVQDDSYAETPSRASRTVNWSTITKMATTVNAEALNESPIPEHLAKHKQTVDPYNVCMFHAASHIPLPVRLTELHRCRARLATTALSRRSTTANWLTNSAPRKSTKSSWTGSRR